MSFDYRHRGSKRYAQATGGKIGTVAPGAVVAWRRVATTPKSPPQKPPPGDTVTTTADTQILTTDDPASVPGWTKGTRSLEFDSEEFARDVLKGHAKWLAANERDVVPVGKVLGQGAYGISLEFKLTNKFKQALARYADTLTALVGVTKNFGSMKSVVIKFASLNEPFPVRRAGEWKLATNGVRELVTEAVRHRRVHTSSTTLFGRRVSGASITPKLFFAGLDPHNGVFVTVMARAPGVTVTKVPNMVVGQKVAIERAIAIMWALGVAHADLHASNILVTTKPPYTAQIIDFGFAVRLPEDIMKNYAKANLENIGAVLPKTWGRAVQYVDHELHGRGISFYNPNYDMLTKLQLRSSNAQVAKARRMTWGNNAAAKSPRSLLTRLKTWRRRSGGGSISGSSATTLNSGGSRSSLARMSVTSFRGVA